MAQFDDFLREQVTPQLGPSESIVGMGLMRCPTRTNALGVPSHYEEWFAVATTQRLLLLRTEATGLLRVRPKASCLELRQWWYADLQGGRTSDAPGAGQGRRLELVPQPLGGPFQGQAKSYDLFPEVDGLDNHAVLYEHYGRWLEQQLASGGLSTDPESRARGEAFERLVRLNAAAHEPPPAPAAPVSIRSALGPDAAVAPLPPPPPAKQRKQRPWLLPLLVLLPFVAGLIVGGIYLGTGLLRLSAARQSLATAKLEAGLDEADVKWVKVGGEPPADCPEAALASELPARAKLCHGCTVQGSSTTEPGHRTFKRGNDYWLCPPVGRYEEKLAASNKARKKAQKRHDAAVWRVEVGSVVSGASLGVGLGLGLWLRRRSRKRKAALLQAAAAEAALRQAAAELPPAGLDFDPFAAPPPGAGLDGPGTPQR